MKIELADAAITDNQTPSAIDILKSMQGTKTITVPLILNGQKVHDGLVFNVGVLEYNNFLNESQNQKISMTASAANFLKRSVAKDDATVLAEAIKVPGLLDFFMGAIVPKVQPDIAESLD